MNEDIDDIELLLRRRRPREVRDDLTRRIALNLESFPRCPAWWQQIGFTHPWAAVGWGLAVPALIVLGTLHFDGVSFTATPPAAAGTVARAEPMNLQATRVSNRRYETTDDGVVMTRELRPVRQTRYQSEDTIAWRDPRTGTQLEVSYPREDVVQIPVTTR